MSSIRTPSKPPAVVRAVGFYFFVLTAFGAWWAAFDLLQGRFPWFPLLAMPFWIGTGIGLLRGLPWAFMAALIAAGVNVIWVVVVIVLAATGFSPGESAGILTWGFLAGEILFGAVPLFLLGHSGRGWFQSSPRRRA